MDSRWKRLLEHMTWADARTLAALERVATLVEAAGETAGDATVERTDTDETAAEDALRIFTHLLQAEAIWITRLEGRESGMLEVWPDPSLQWCRTTAAATHGALGTFLGRLGDADPIVTYRNQTGRSFENRTSDILLHLFLHGAYHRGQIARLLREGGEAPVNTDLITLAREQVP